MTRLMVLGLLMMRSMSGYEIQSFLQQSRTDQWAGILPGSIYHALKKMEGEALVRVENVEQTGNRTKATYGITPEGRTEFLRLLKESFALSSVQLPTTLYTAVSFLHLLPKEETTTAIDAQIQLLKQELADMKAGQVEKEKAASIQEYILLTFENMYEHYEVQLRFLRKLRESVERMPIDAASDSLTKETPSKF